MQGRLRSLVGDGLSGETLGGRREVIEATRLGWPVCLVCMSSQYDACELERRLRVLLVERITDIKTVVKLVGSKRVKECKTNQRDRIEAAGFRRRLDI